ncbi:hypothetical protein D3C79_355190 [compost metagenome]
MTHGFAIEVRVCFVTTWDVANHLHSGFQVPCVDPDFVVTYPMPFEAGFHITVDLHQVEVGWEVYNECHVLTVPDGPFEHECRIAEHAELATFRNVTFDLFDQLFYAFNLHGDVSLGEYRLENKRGGRSLLSLSLLRN